MAEVLKLRAELEEQRAECSHLRASLAASEAESNQQRQAMAAAAKRGGKSESGEMASLQALVSKVCAEKEAAWNEAANMRTQLRTAQEEADELRSALHTPCSQSLPVTPTPSHTLTPPSTPCRTAPSAFCSLSFRLCPCRAWHSFHPLPLSPSLSQPHSPILS